MRHLPLGGYPQRTSFLCCFFVWIVSLVGIIAISHLAFKACMRTSLLCLQHGLFLTSQSPNAPIAPRKDGCKSCSVCVCVCPPRCYCARLYGFVLFTRFEIFISMRCYVNVNMDVSHVFCVFLYMCFWKAMFDWIYRLALEEIRVSLFSRWSVHVLIKEKGVGKLNIFTSWFLRMNSKLFKNTCAKDKFPWGNRNDEFWQMSSC